MQLTPQNGEGKPANQPLPTLMTQVFFDKKISLLAVIFDVKNSPVSHFEANLLTYNIVTLTLARQEDFLWQNHCYELFLAFSNEKNSPYLEINISPKGKFSLYHFDGYRTPAKMPPRRLQMTVYERQQLINCYSISQDWHAVFWHDSLPSQRDFRDLIETNFPLEADTHRLVMMVNMEILARLLKVEKSDEIWLNPCAVYKGEQDLAYFAHQHASPPDFHDKKCWIECN